MKPAAKSLIIILGPSIGIFWLVIYSLKTSTELDWGTVLILGLVVSYFGQIILVMTFLGLMASYATFFCRGLCPHCGTKNLRAEQACCDSIDGDFFFMLSKCDQCQWQFREYTGEEQISIPPDDERYWADYEFGEKRS
ncbi:MAG: hypothetical protein QM496_21760 [Verrucomicrobiota bacterium]